MNKDLNKENNFKTPILFLIFNRPKLTKQVFAEIKKIKPKQLYIAADGPRKNKLNDKEKCKETRKIINNINWNCEIKTLFREENLGCKKAVSSAITWFFKNVKQGIILEDDVLPDQSFFFFCQKILNKYKNNKKIFNISGNNFQNGIQRGKGSYYFSKYFHCWGWATWSDRWNNYFDIKMKDYPKLKKQKKIRNIFNTKMEQKYWTNIFEKVYKGKIDSWAYIWTFNCWDNKGITCLPNVNLVENIGFGAEATHTFNSQNKKEQFKRKNIDLPLIPPPKIEINKKADKHTSKVHFKINSKKLIIHLLKKIKLLNFAIKLKNIFKK